MISYVKLLCNPQNFQLNTGILPIKLPILIYLPPLRIMSPICALVTYIWNILQVELYITGLYVIGLLSLAWCSQGLTAGLLCQDACSFKIEEQFIVLGMFFLSVHL